MPCGATEFIRAFPRACCADSGAAVTYCEVTTAAALLAFAEHPADAIILEVGLGGRLDATNVVAQPALAVITPIAIDHTDWLGASISLIAAEKAGILKGGVPAVISRQPPQAITAIRSQASKMKAPLTVW